MSRLAEIDQELLDMGMTPDTVDEYVRVAGLYHGNPTVLDCYLPLGTLPHKEYESRLDGLIESISVANQAAQAAKEALQHATEAAEAAKPCLLNSHAIIAQQLAHRTECLQRKLKHPKALKNELYLHLTRFKPINAEAHRERLDALIGEKIDILTEIRRSAICSIATDYKSQH